MAKVEGYSIDIKIDGKDFGPVVHVFKDLPELAEGVQVVRGGLEKDGYQNIKMVRVDLDKTGVALRKSAKAGVTYKRPL